MKFYGLYRITNLTNGKMYTGQHVTDNIDDGYMGSGTHIKRAVKKYGPENFRKEWLGFYEDQDELNYMERVFADQTWVDRADTYNLKVGGDGGAFSEETKKKISENTKKAMANPQIREKIVKAHKGKTPWNKGQTGVYKWSEAQRQKMHEALSKPRPSLKGRQPWNKGKKTDQKTKDRISESTKKAMTAEVRAKISSANVARAGKVYWNNGKIRVLAKECPGKGWTRGRRIDR